MSETDKKNPPMTAGELIEQLQNYSPTMRVFTAEYTTTGETLLFNPKLTVQWAKTTADDAQPRPFKEEEARSLRMKLRTSVVLYPTDTERTDPTAARMAALMTGRREVQLKAERAGAAVVLADLLLAWARGEVDQDDVDVALAAYARARTAHLREVSGG